MLCCKDVTQLWHWTLLFYWSLFTISFASPFRKHVQSSLMALLVQFLNALKLSLKQSLCKGWKFWSAGTVNFWTSILTCKKNQIWDQNLKHVLCVVAGIWGTCVLKYMHSHAWTPCNGHHVWYRGFQFWDPILFAISCNMIRLTVKNYGRVETDAPAWLHPSDRQYDLLEYQPSQIFHLGLLCRVRLFGPDLQPVFHFWNTLPRAALQRASSHERYLWSISVHSVGTPNDQIVKAPHIWFWKSNLWVLPRTSHLASVAFAMYDLASGEHSQPSQKSANSSEIVICASMTRNALIISNWNHHLLSRVV